jgi:hypothetical protein
MVRGIDETRVAKGGPLVRPWLVERGSAGGSGGVNTAFGMDREG